MTNVSPWSVKGVEPEAREAAKIAARRADMTIGQWLNHTIRAAATQQVSIPSPAPQGTVLPEGAHYDESPDISGCPETRALQSENNTARAERAMQRLSERLEQKEASRKADNDNRQRSIFSRYKISFPSKT